MSLKKISLYILCLFLSLGTEMQFLIWVVLLLGSWCRIVCALAITQ